MLKTLTILCITLITATTFAKSFEEQMQEQQDAWTEEGYKNLCEHNATRFSIGYVSDKNNAQSDEVYSVGHIDAAPQGASVEINIFNTDGIWLRKETRAYSCRICSDLSMDTVLLGTAEKDICKLQ